MKFINWEVGSYWYIMPTLPVFPDDICESVDRLYENVSFLSTCRSAIGLCLRKIRNARVALVPAFTCHSVIEPFKKLGIKVIGYPIKADLSVDWDGLISLVDKYSPQIVLIHGYFGFNTTGDWYGPIKELFVRGITIIEDLTQTMFSCYEHIQSHYKVGSIRKWMPMPDGAFLTNLKIQDLHEDTTLSEAKWKALVEKGNYVFNGKGNKELFMARFVEAERLLDSRSKPFAMSKISYAILGQMDVENFKKTRQENYNCLLSRLGQHPDIKLIHPQLRKDEVPFLLPVYVENNRSGFQRFMAQHNVFPTIIWKSPDELVGKIDAVSTYVYNNILCFHIDQRYDINDMNRVGDIVDLYFNSVI